MPAEMSSTAAEGAKPPADTYDFSLILGGPLFQLIGRAHLSGDALELLRPPGHRDLALRVAPAVDPVDAGRARMG